MKHCNNRLKPLNNITKYSKRKEEHEWTQMDKIETDCIWVILKTVGRCFSSSWQNAWIFKAVFAQNRLVCGVTIILSVKELHITIFEF